MKTAHLRFEHIRQPRRALTDRNVTQLHYARQGIITPEMEYIAIRENMARAQLKEACQPSQQHLGEAFGAQIPDEITASLSALRWRGVAPSFLPTSTIRKSSR